MFNAKNGYKGTLSENLGMLYKSKYTKMSKR